MRSPAKFGVLVLGVLTAAAGLYWRSTGAEHGVSSQPSGRVSPEIAAASALGSASAAAVDAATPASASAPGIAKVSRSLGKPVGVALPAKPPEVTSGAEKGLAMEIAPLEARQLEGLKAGDVIEIPVPGGSVKGRVNLVQTDEGGWVRVGGNLQGRAGEFQLSGSLSASGGLIQVPGEGRAYEILMEPDGRVLVVERRLSDVRCYVAGVITNDRQAAVATTSTTPAKAVAAVPLLSSRPSATAVVYLDFDGETVTDPSWNGGRTIVAPASTLTTAQITEVFNRVKEDYLPFNVDITTDRSRYDGAPASRRTRCIITSNDAAAPGAGGVAFVGSFARAGTSSYSATIPCWAFNSTVVGVAEAVSHEVGHTLGLRHDGRTSPVEDYYAGAGSGATSWGPIMGASYNRSVVQWSKGEYKSANNTEDDLAIISASTNGLGYVADEAGGTTGTAAALSVSSNTINQTGVITFADIDVYRFEASGGALAVTANPAAVSPDLDIKLELLDASGGVLQTVNPDAALSATLSATLTAGTYYLRVSGTGRGDVLVDGYSSYASIGAYTLTGTVAAGPVSQSPSITSAQQVGGGLGTAFSYQITATNSATAYAVSGTLPAGLSLNTSTGLISGVPSVAGSFTVTVTATNAQGSGSASVTIVIAPPQLPLADAVDASGLAFTTSGSVAWSGQSTVSFDGVDAAKSGAIADGQSSIMSTTVAGPVLLDFRWKVESEAGYDKLAVLVDGVVVDAISGTTAWALRTLSIPAGSHRVDWRYQKDAFVSAGADAGWVDTVAVRAVSSVVRVTGDLAFGEVAVGARVRRDVTIANDGNMPINITSISLPAGFTGNASGTLAAGASAVVGVTFAPTASQAYSGNLTVNCDAVSGTRTVAVSGSGVLRTVELKDGVPLTNQSGDAGSQVFYRITVPAGCARLSVSTTGGTGDLDLYLKQGTQPTLTNFSLRSNGSTATEKVEVNYPAAGDWFVLANGYRAYAGVTITAQLGVTSYAVGLSASGPGTVSGAGTFPTGSAVVVTATPSTGAVFNSWTEQGAVVSTSASYQFVLTGARSLVANFAVSNNPGSGGQVTGIAGAAGTEWAYTVSVPANTSRLVVSTFGGTGDVDLYLKKGARPTTSDYLVRSAWPTNSETIVVIRPQAGDWVVMLRAYRDIAGVQLNISMDGGTNNARENQRAAAQSPVVAASRYAGLVTDATPTSPLVGGIQIEMSARSAFSGQLTLEGRRHAFHGRLDQDARWTGMLNLEKGVKLPISLSAETADGSPISGSLDWNGRKLEIRALQTLRSAQDAAVVPGNYILNWNTAAGTETLHSSLVLGSRGGVQFWGWTPEGTVVRFSGELVRGGLVPVSYSKPRGGGSGGGWLQFVADESGARFSGNLAEQVQPQLGGGLPSVLKIAVDGEVAGTPAAQR